MFVARVMIMPHSCDLEAPHGYAALRDAAERVRVILEGRPRDGERNLGGIVQSATPRHALREDREQGPHMSGCSDVSVC